MTPARHVIYLHGFTSSPASSRADYFRRELEARGVGFACPDLNQPEFETLTVTRMLEDTREAIRAAPAGPVALVGSSLGGFVAVHAAAEDTTGRVDRLVLLAPAIDFGGNRLESMGPHGIEEWRRQGRIRIFHYAWNEYRDIGFALYEDAARYDAFALDLPLPMLVVQGREDDVVDPAMVERWTSTRPSADLRLVGDDHRLSGSLEMIWTESAKLFGVFPTRRGRRA